MARKVLVTYASNAGSTTAVAQKIAEELQRSGLDVEVRAMADVSDLSAYSAAIVGAPMILGWHRGATAFLKAHQQALQKMPTAYFVTSLELTRTGASEIGGVPLFIDPMLGHVAKNSSKLSFKEKQTADRTYFNGVLHAAPSVKPVSVAFFGGALDYSKLKPLQKLFVRYVIGAKAGDYRNWSAITAWAGEIGSSLGAAA